VETIVASSSEGLSLLGACLRAATEALLPGEPPRDDPRHDYLHRQVGLEPEAADSNTWESDETSCKVDMTVYLLLRAGAGMVSRD
jgi:hypothetical protein